MARALTVNDILNKKYKLFPFEGEWKEAFDCPETSGVIFIWGNSGNGKTTFVLQLIKYLANFENVVFNSLEEGSANTMQRGYVRVGMANAKKKVLLVEESMEDLSLRLLKKKSPNVAVIDSFQATKMSYSDYLEFKHKHKKKLLVFISQAKGTKPKDDAALSAMFDATLKIHVEKYRAVSKGRYIGETGYYNIFPEGIINTGGTL